MAFTSRGPDGPEALVSFGAALYNELFTAIVEHVNKNFSSTSTLSRISVCPLFSAIFIVLFRYWISPARITIPSG